MCEYTVRIGRRIKEMREYRGWFQCTLAERCSMSQQYLSSIERGEKSMTVTQLAKFAEALHCDLLVDFKVKETL